MKTSFAVLIAAAALALCASASFAGEEIVCRFYGLEKIHKGSEPLKFTLSQDKAVATFEAYRRTQEVRTIIKGEGEKEFFDTEDKRNLRSFLEMFEGGSNPVFSNEETAQFLEVERPYYQKILEGTHTVSEYHFLSAVSGFRIESVYNFYDQNGTYVASFGYGPRNGVVNFCIPE